MDQSRRKLLKLLAATPLYLTFGLAGTALMRFAKPSMSPLGVFDPADEPESAIKIVFQKDDLPEPWTCIPFDYQMKIKIFNPQEEEIRKIPSFLIRLGDGEIVAYSRKCPRGKNCNLVYLPHPKERCGCAPKGQYCCCTFDIDNPVLMCACDGSIFDLARNGKVLLGRAPRPPRRYELKISANTIAIERLEQGSIV